MAGLMIASVPAVTAQGDLKEVPRDRTLVFGEWGFSTGLPGSDDWHVYNQAPQKNYQLRMGNKGILEALFYTNLNTGELIPWQGESFEYNDDFTEVTLNLRDGVTWCDGVPLSADDVKFTLEMLRDNAPDLEFSFIYEEWLKEVEVIDPLTAKIVLNKPGPRWFRDNLALGHENHQVILPKHIWDGQNPRDVLDEDGETVVEEAFTFFDLEKGWPCGTGPYQIVSATDLQLIADRRDTWWAVETGFVDRMPHPERLILTPLSDDTAASQLYISNDVDFGNPLQPGTFAAAKELNPSLISWNAEGPIWGAPDGCGYNVIFNNAKEPWSDANVRRAINYAIVRQQISDFGYEGANYPIVLPFSAYMAPNWIPGRIQEVIDKYDRGTPSQEKVDEHMALAGYERNADGKWAKDGEVLEVPIYGASFFQPAFPILVQNLQDAGFVSDLEATASNEWIERLLPGTFETLNFVHCGSLAEPYDTLKHLHTKLSRPIGENTPDMMASQRFQNTELDGILDRMEAIQADSARTPSTWI